MSRAELKMELCSPRFLSQCLCFRAEVRGRQRG